MPILNGNHATVFNRFSPSTKFWEKEVRNGQEIKNYYYG